VRFEDDKDLTTSSSKTYLSALKELKSSDAAIEFRSRNEGLSKLQIRRCVYVYIYIYICIYIQIRR
jgi:hypothetical protein